MGGDARALPQRVRPAQEMGRQNETQRQGWAQTRESCALLAAGVKWNKNSNSERHREQAARPGLAQPSQLGQGCWLFVRGLVCMGGGWSTRD